MLINEKTKLIDILKEYPSLENKLKELDPQFGIISTPVGKLLLKKHTVQDVSDKFHVPVRELLDQLDKLIEKL